VFGLLCSGVVNAQQTFFTIPSGEITHKGKHFYQVQANFVDIHSTQAEFDFDYGIGHHWEVGFNLNTDLSWKKHTKFLEVEDSLSHNPVTPLFLFNMQKGIPILPHPKLRINFGTQMGTNLINHGEVHFAYVGYVLLASEFKEDWHVNIGTYLTNRPFAGGEGNEVGVLGGIEIPFSERWAVMSDATFGKNPNCIATLGFSYNPTNRIQLCLGGLTSTPGNPIKQSGIVFEISFFGWDFCDKDED
jgi:hypothetical protein